MRRKPASRRTRLISLGLELGGAIAVACAVAVWSWPVALLLGGVLLILAAQFLEDIL